MKKVINLVLVLLLITVSFSGCKSDTSRFTGNWVCAGESSSHYPDQMTLNNDGTGMADGYSLSWYAQDGTLTLNVGSAFIGTLTYEYEFQGSTLYLDEHSYNKV